MTVKDFYTAVAGLADNDTQKIGAGETSRVLSVAFQLMATCDAATLTGLIAKGIELGAKKAGK